MSDSITIQIDGMELLGRDLDKYVQDLRREANDRTQEAGINTQAEAKKAAPVGTPESTGIPNYHGGRLRSSIQYKPGILSAEVGSDVEYAAPVEEGHITRSGSHVPARPFLFPAFEREKQKYLDDLRRMVQ